MPALLESLFWPDRFHRFSLLHGLVVVVFVGLIVAAISLARIEGPTERRTRVERRCAWLILLVWVGLNVERMRPGRFAVDVSLPLHLCDAAAVIVPLSLLFEWRPLVALNWFWGFGLSSQGFFSPTLDVGPGHDWFWRFWSLHYLIVGAALYWVGARGFRPTARDFVYAVVALAVYTGIVLPIDLALDVNYGFLGPELPEVPSILDYLGAWPRRLFALTAIIVAWFAILWLVFPLGRWLGRRGAARPAA